MKRIEEIRSKRQNLHIKNRFEFILSFYTTACVVSTFAVSPFAIVYGLFFFFVNLKSL